MYNRRNRIGTRQNNTNMDVFCCINASRESSLLRFIVAINPMKAFHGRLVPCDTVSNGVINDYQFRCEQNIAGQIISLAYTTTAFSPAQHCMGTDIH